MRPAADCGVEVTVYTGDGFGHYDPTGWDYDGPARAEVWRVWCPPGSWLPYSIADKVHRIRHAMDMTNQNVVLDRFTLPPSHKGHRRLNYNRYVWVWPLPKKIQRALED